MCSQQQKTEKTSPDDGKNLNSDLILEKVFCRIQIVLRFNSIFMNYKMQFHRVARQFWLNNKLEEKFIFSLVQVNQKMFSVARDYI